MPDLLVGHFRGLTVKGDLATDAPAFLRHHGRHGVADHVERVATNAFRIADQVVVNQNAALSHCGTRNWASGRN